MDLFKDFYKLVRSFYLPERLPRAYWRALSERIR